MCLKSNKDLLLALTTERRWQVQRGALRKGLQVFKRYSASFIAHTCPADDEGRQGADEGQPQEEVKCGWLFVTQT